ncbi:PDZ domain-containing protein [Corynebacterium sp. TAE3-ERU12]|uniref:YlbL family protein n=1 Tax=Corynebacterium sp. TAE3-ERU12 TaxID=2849491 RepID=UPI0021020EEF|nr:PDZ domain-containing protein [Corynebacterium sp. TAE3-ERU12]
MSTLLVGAVPIVGLGALLLSPAAVVPYAAEGPGPVVNVLGDYEGKPIVDIKGADVDEAATGEIDMTTVAVGHRLNLPQALSLWADENYDLVPIEAIFPPGMSEEEVDERNTLMFDQSEANATAAAMKELDYPLEVSVGTVLDDGAAKNVLQQGDIIIAVDGKKMFNPRAVQDAINRYAPGDSVTVTVRREGKVIDQDVTLGENPENPKRGQLGIAVMAKPANGVDINYNVSGIGGPSAGLVLTLAIIDKLTEGDLTGGKHVAGTGTIDGAGVVGPIGGITHKIAAAKAEGADFFLVPDDNCAEALTADAGDMQLYAVTDVQEALSVLDDPATAERCGAGS